MLFPKFSGAPSRAFLVGVAGLSLVLAACGDDDDTAATSGTTMPAHGADTTMAAVGHNEADVAFATGMIPHHRQAVEMADMLITNGNDPAVIDLAERIKAAQAPEIETMTGWLEEWGEPMADPPMEGHGGDADAESAGMMSSEEMAALEAAESPELERLFLEGMIVHHEGAIAMAETELTGGESADAKALAQDIIDAQQAEIGEMETLLGTG